MNYRILIIFDKNIPEATGHQIITYVVSHLTHRMFLHYLRKLKPTKYLKWYYYLM